MTMLTAMPRYEAYKDSGIEWLGEVPSSWSVQRIKHETELLTGFPFSSSKYSESGIKLARGINVKEGRTDWGETVFWPEITPDLKKYELQAGDILIGMDGSKVGKNVCQIENKDLPLLLLQRVARIRAKQQLVSSFLYWCFLNRFFLDWINKSKTDPMIPHIAPSDINDYVIAFPDISIQVKIANFLDEKTAKIDEAISIKQKQIELLKERKQIIIQQAVTQGLDPTVPMKDSGVEWIGKIPAHWKVNRIKNLGKIINGFAFPSDAFKEDGVRVIKISNIQPMNIDWSESSFVDESWLKKCGQFCVYDGDLVFALTRPIISTGIKVATVKTSEKILINQRNAVFRPLSTCSVDWLYYIILSNGFINEFESEIDITGQQPNISTISISNLSIPIPSLDIQLSISAYLSKKCSEIDACMIKMNEQISILKEYKTTLINSAVTGKIKVV